MSFGDIREMVCMVICAKEGADNSCYIVDIFPDSVVYESTGKDGVCKYYQRSYSIVDGQVTLGDATEVEKQVEYVPLSAAAEIMAATGSDDKGALWRVRVIGWGPDKQGRIDWQREPLVAALPLFDGAKVFALNDSQHRVGGSKFGKSPRELVGALSTPEVCTDGIYASLVILPSAAWLQADLRACEERSIPYVYGLSIDVGATTKQSVVAGKKMLAPVKIGSVQVDVVYDPVGKGEFLQQLAAARQAGQEEEQMLTKLLAALQGKRPDLFKQINDGMTAGTITDDKALEMIAAATVKDAGGDEANTQLVASIVAGLKETLGQGENETLNEMKLVACGMTLDRELTASKLPDAAQKTIREQFEGKVFEPATLQAAIKSTKELIDSLTASGQITGAGDQRVSVGRESVDRLQAAFDGMLHVPLPDTMRDVPVFTSLRAAYVEMTGDTDITGVLNPQQIRRMQAAYGDATFAYVLGNTLYRRLTNDYREWTDYGVSRLVGNNIRNARDFRALQSIRIGYYGDIPIVDTDTQDYPDLGEVSDEKVEYALLEKGGIITVNRRTIINDDVRAIERIISRLPRAARRTLAKAVWTPFTTNAVYKGDSKAIFHADHNNLGATAYGIASAEAARAAMFGQTEPGSLEKLGLRPVTVAFPSALRGLVTNVNNFNPQAVAIADGNSMFGYFQAAGLFENPFMSDANDWIYAADPNEVEIVELAFLNGQQEPQMLVADNPAVGQQFVGGRIQYRITHDYNAEVVDYRGVYKAVVA